MSEQTPVQEIEASFTKPLSTVDRSLMQAFAKDVAAQATRLDELGKQLIALGLALPGLYGAVLKLVYGHEATLDNPLLLVVAFLCWAFALAFAWRSLMPERQHIDPEDLDAIQAYFSEAAQRKQHLLWIASTLQFLGICLAVFGLLLR